MSAVEEPAGWGQAQLKQTRLGTRQCSSEGADFEIAC